MKGRVFSLVLSLIFASSVLTGMAPRVNTREGVAYADRPFYQMDTTFYPEKDELTGHMVVTLPEKRNEPQNEVYFRLYPNAFQNWKHKASKPGKTGLHPRFSCESGWQKRAARYQGNGDESAVAPFPSRRTIRPH